MNFDWDKWYERGGNGFIYYAATGYKPDLRLIVGRTLMENRGELLDNIMSSNLLCSRLIEKVNKATVAHLSNSEYLGNSDLGTLHDARIEVQDTD